MILQNKPYVPTLAVRASEMKGLEYLPRATKDRMTPCFLLAPWVNSNTLERSIERIQRAYPSRHYFLDIDRDYNTNNPESVPYRELIRLLDGANAFKNWVDFVGDHEWVYPCIQSLGLNKAEIQKQILSFQKMKRPYGMRIVRRDRFPTNIGDLVRAFAAGGTADFAIILEGGWTRDPLSLAVWFSGLVSESLQAIDASVPTVLSCTSIPKLFTEFKGITCVPFNNRKLVDQIDRQSNRTQVVYGDWGSTRPRKKYGFAIRPFDRIDYPVDGSWHISRNKDENWDFQRAAKEIVANSTVWDGNLGIWGEEMIYRTTINPALGINTPQKNIAARVNIHLHRQAFFGGAVPDPIEFDEDWED